MELKRYCSNCGMSLSLGARFCSRCGERQEAQEAKPALEVRDFIVPLPSDAPFARMAFEGSDRPFTRNHLSALGVANPSRSDFYWHRALSHVWYYFADYVRARLEEISKEGWVICEEFEPKVDAYGVLTTQGIRERIVIENASDDQNRGDLLFVRGFSIKMERRSVQSSPGEGQKGA